MIPAAFDYVRAGTLEEASQLLSRHGEDAKLLAGGHSLLPAMKLRLARPSVVIDIGRVSGVDAIREEAGRIVIGALATHYAIESSPILRRSCPLLCDTAARIGDVQVRNRGTIGGSLAHADPAADWPAAILALEAEIEVVSGGSRRRIQASDFFTEMLQTALAPTEIIAAIHVGPTGSAVAYEKFAQKASGFAVAGAAVVIDGSTVRVGITGVGPTAYRASAVEMALRGKKLTPESIAQAAGKAADGIDALSDMHASSDYRAHLATVATRRAIEKAISRA